MIPDILADLTASVARAADPDFPLESLSPTGNPAHGDYQWNFAFRLAKARKGNPRALAEVLAASFVHPAIRKVEVAGPGFINVYLEDAWLASAVVATVTDPTFGVPQVGAGRTVIVDFSSPNVAKRMHVGHMRSTHLGHALYRMHAAAGWSVVGDNHIGDWGTQFGKLIVAWGLWRDEAAYAADPIGELERIYVEFGDRVKLGEEATEAQKAEAVKLVGAARAETVKLQRGDAENTALWQRFMDVSMTEFNAVYDRMGVRFDVVLGESTYRNGTEDVVAGLLADGVAEESDGAIIVRFTEPSLKNQPMMVRKSDGGSNYATTDLACLRYRMARWSPARVVYVTDMRQQGHFAQLFAVAKKWNVPAELVHAWFGMLVLPEGAMSTRKGNVIRLVDFLDEAVARARAVVDTKSPHLPEAERAAIADAVGLGAVRYSDLSQHPQTNVTFDWDRMLSFDGNTAPYLLYSHARAASLLAKAGDAVDLGALRLGEAVERDLALCVARYPEAVNAALSTSRPNLLADHLFEVANKFNRFYHDLPVIQGGEHRASRLALVDVSRRVLRHGMEILGLTVLDRM